MSTAAKVREQKEKHPERYCPVRNCLWNISHSPCRKHPKNVTPVSIPGEDVSFDLPLADAVCGAVND